MHIEIMPNFHSDIPDTHYAIHPEAFIIHTCAVAGCLIIAPLHFWLCFILATYLSASFYLDTLLNV